VAALQVSVPISHELLGQCIKQGQALVQRASLVGDFSDYESWKAARRQWIDASVQALRHMYDGSREASEFADAVSSLEQSKRWQDQYAADLKCVEEAIGLLTILQGDLAFSGAPPTGAAELTAGSDEPALGTDVPGPADQPPAATADVEEGDASAPASAANEEPPREHASVVSEALDAQLEPPAREREPSGPAPFAEPPREEPEATPAVGSELEPAQPPSAELAAHAADAPAERDAGGAPDASPTRTREVLLAHGRDERWKQAVEHLLERAGEHEIRIVSQRAGERGRLADVLGEGVPMPRYAVVLLTADDIAGPRLESEAEPFFSTRADQEVVFAMGFLVAALSPGCVCVLYEDGVELPYDVEGVSHVRLDLAGSWQPKLLLHLRRAGFDYDMNKLVPV
jgi:predicted nucleotide-binding protein